MRRLREGELISIVIDGKIRWGRIRRNNDGLHLDVRGMKVFALDPALEGVKWARGWKSAAAKALAVSTSLDEPKTPTIGEAGRKLIHLLGKAVVERPDEVLDAVVKVLDALSAKSSP